MTNVPKDAAMALDRAQKAHTDAQLDVRNSGDRYKGEPSEENRLTYRADLQALLGATMDLKAAEDVVFAHSVPQLATEHVDLFNRFRVDHAADAENIAQRIELLDQIGHLRSSAPPEQDQPGPIT